MQLPTTGESKIFVRFRNEIINNSPSYQNATNEMNTNRLSCLQEEKQVEENPKGHLMTGISAAQKGIFCVLGFWVAELERTFRLLVTHALTLQAEVVCWTVHPELGSPDSRGLWTIPDSHDKMAKNPGPPVTVPRLSVQPSRSPAVSGCSPLQARYFCNFRHFFFLLEICV